MPLHLSGANLCADYSNVAQNENMLSTISVYFKQYVGLKYSSLQNHTIRSNCFLPV